MTDCKHEYFFNSEIEFQEDGTVIIYSTCLDCKQKFAKKYIENIVIRQWRDELGGLIPSLEMDEEHKKLLYNRIEDLNKIIRS
jgi:hypothetical protein